MKPILFLCLLVTSTAAGQNTFVARIVDAQSKTPLPGASLQIKALKRGAVADAGGVVILTGIPNGDFDVEVRFLGYEEVEKEYDFPLDKVDTLTIALSPEGKNSER